jgi:hypothetical protein
MQETGLNNNYYRTEVDRGFISVKRRVSLEKLPVLTDTLLL